MALSVKENFRIRTGFSRPNNQPTDVATQARVVARLFNPQSTIINPQYEGAPWGPVYGELLAFDDPEIRLQTIDRLEGFHPGGPCLYCRVLVPVQVNRSVLPAWLYVVGDRWTGSVKELIGGIWG